MAPQPHLRMQQQSYRRGLDEACTPEHLPWRQAHDVVNYLATNFFDATLRGDPQALRNLQKKALASIPDLNYQSK